MSVCVCVCMLLCVCDAVYVCLRVFVWVCLYSCVGVCLCNRGSQFVGVSDLCDCLSVCLYVTISWLPKFI